MDVLSAFFTPIVGFLITVVFGLWLSIVGRPYNGILFNIHKLIALGTVILASMKVYELLKVMEYQSSLAISLVVVVLCVVSLFLSGAFLSVGNVKYEVVILIHNISPVIMVIAMGCTIYLLHGRIP